MIKPTSTAITRMGAPSFNVSMTAARLSSTAWSIVMGSRQQEKGERKNSCDAATRKEELKHCWRPNDA
jgi:hypothetical protein